MDQSPTKKRITSSHEVEDGSTLASWLEKADETMLSSLGPPPSRFPNGLDPPPEMRDDLPAHIAEIRVAIPFDEAQASFSYRDIDDNVWRLDENHLLPNEYALAHYIKTVLPDVERVTLIFIIEMGDLTTSAQADLEAIVEMLVNLTDYEFDIQYISDQHMEYEEAVRLHEAVKPVFLEAAAENHLLVITTQDIFDSWGKGKSFRYTSLQVNADLSASAALVLEDEGVIEID